jgi:Holliday junction resolvasome RuvABC DNA-binding subunit
VPESEARQRRLSCQTIHDQPPARAAPSNQPLPDFMNEPQQELAVLDDDELEEKVFQLMQLGFPRADSENALKACGFRIEMAIEHLSPAGRRMADQYRTSDPQDELTGEESDDEELDDRNNDQHAQDPLENFGKEEQERIERLQQLGFDLQTVIQVYVVCDKDENVAANCLLPID